jgi:predicted metal-dependent enzyme (double-stranded beta helix superfamily)
MSQMNIVSPRAGAKSPLRPHITSLPAAKAIVDHDSLRALTEDIRHACIGPVDAVPASVAKALNQAAWLEQCPVSFSRADATAGYTRHVLHGDPQGRFTVVAILWEPGQFSPVHAHHTWCAYHVVYGTLSERLYSWDINGGRANYTGTVARLPGDSCAGHAGLEQIHSLGNPGDVPALSVHVYGIDSDRIATHVNRVVTAAPH